MKQVLKLKRTKILMLLPIALIIEFIAYKSKIFAEWYATTIYPFISLTINHITSFFPFSIAEFIVIFSIIIIIVYIIIYLYKIIKFASIRKLNLLKFILNPICIICFLYFTFIIFCGTNYNRITFAEKNELIILPSPETELIEICNKFAKQANEFRKQVDTDENNIMKLGNYNIGEEARISYSKLSNDFNINPNYTAPKSVLFSKLMSYSNITGIFFPFTFEANVNVDIPEYSIPSTMCHELTHLRGYMREDEANFIAYLACMKSEKSDFKYSGTMLAYIYTSNALYNIDKDMYFEIDRKLSPDVKRDLNYNNIYWEQFKGSIADISNKVNDSYLKANNQNDGVKSYGRVVDLLLADYRKNKNILNKY